MSVRLCPACNSIMHIGHQFWHLVCPRCGYENASLEVAINESLVHEQINEVFREKGLQHLRFDNFKKLLRTINLHVSKKGSLLDVGCAHGWFLQAAQKSGFAVLGLEPDLNVYSTILNTGVPVRLGFFPQILSPDEQFDVIVFNDVFEHIPDVQNVLAACLMHLKDDGILVLNLPSSSGFFYKLSSFLTLLKINLFFDRMWQKGLPSPHLHYFNKLNLNLLLNNNGFDVVTTGRLSSISLKGLFTRISYTNEYSFGMRLIILLCVILTYPFVMIFPSDIMYSISTKKTIK